MRKILVDTNVILDVLLDRRPHAEASAAIWSLVETGAAEGLLAVHAITTIHYLIQKQVGEMKATRAIAAILKVFDVAPIDFKVIEAAIQLHLPDFEDAVTASAAFATGCDWIATRDPRGFRGSTVRAITPQMLIPLLK